jgi:hypothetical protein
MRGNVQTLLPLTVLMTVLMMGVLAYNCQHGAEDVAEAAVGGPCGVAGEARTDGFWSVVEGARRGVGGAWHNVASMK